MEFNQIVDFIENGNIKNSVNYPSCDMGVCTKAGRIAVCHKNIPNLISQFTGAMAASDINISEMVNKSKGNYAYTLLDLDSEVTKAAIEKIKSINGVIKVRVVK